MATYTVTAGKMASNGNCLAKLDGRNIFIPGVIPEETVEIEVDNISGKERVNVVSVIEPSPYRIESGCPYYGICGGCNMRHIDAAFQTELRASILTHLFERQHIDIPEFHVITAHPDGYRCRMQLHDGGLKSRMSNKVIPITECPVATEPIRSWLATVPTHDRPSGRIHVFGDRRATGINGDNIVIAAEHIPQQERSTSGKSLRKVKNKVRSKFSGTVNSTENLCTVALSVQDKTLPLSSSHNEKTIVFDVRGFFQSNMDMLEKTIAEMFFNSMGTSGKHALDIYSGAGTFSVFMADRFEHITLVEHNRDALVYAERNLAGIPHESYGVDGEHWASVLASGVMAAKGSFDMAVVDPPRSGMEPGVLRFLQESGIPYLKSVSCDPSSHAANCSKLIQSGYALKKLYLLDFYPQTSHIESLAILERI